MFIKIGKTGPKAKIHAEKAAGDILPCTAYSHLLLYNHCFFKDTLHRTPHNAKNKIRFIVNFAPEIQEMTSEATYLGLLGYTVPTVALNVALQEHKLIRYLNKNPKPINGSEQITDPQSFWHVSLSIFRFSDDLHRLVNRYHFALNSLNEMKNIMLAEKICAVQNEMYVGCKRLNWNSLGMLHTEP